MNFSIIPQFDEDKNCWDIKVSGEIDIYNSVQVKTQLSDLRNEHNADLRIDCEELEYIDSTGLGALVSILKGVKEDGHEMHLTNLRGNIMKLFKITDLDKVFFIDGVE